MVIFTFVLAILLSVVTVASAQDSNPYDTNNHFISPAPASAPITKDPRAFSSNEVFEAGKPITLRWATNMSAIQIMMWREGVVQPIDKGQEIESDLTVKEYTWNGVLHKDYQLSEDAVFYFAAYQNGEVDPVFFSHYFNLTRKTATTSKPTSTSTSISTTISSTQTSSTDSSQESSSKPSSQSSTSSQKSEKSSSSSTHSAAIGGAVGGAIIIAGLAYLYIRRHYQRKQTLQYYPQYYPQYSDQSAMKVAAQRRFASSPAPAYKPRDTLHELAASP